ncbi:MAG: DUF4373 domain-containing protein [Lachnospiraceae bacterium]|nr:DUF4373 domain-containing protein [Bacteroides fragilis]MCM1218996.1 DUF4373 domain-containing protein [Lachnospiraceae bacterium]
MARPKQDGLLYFPFDTDFFYADKRIKRLRSKFGNDGLIFYIYLLTEIYRNGYYIGWDEESTEDAIDSLSLTEGFIEQVLTYLVSRSLLVKSILANSVTILTSPGIQKRYQEAIKSRKRDVYVDAEIWLLEEKETAPYIKVTRNDNKSCGNDNKSCGNDNKSCGNAIKESKVKESKVKQREPLRRIEDFLSAYPKKCHRYLTEKEYCDLIMVGKVSEDDLVACAKNYAEYCKLTDLDERYIKNPENFLKDFTFEEYLPGKYKKPAKKQKNSFNDFPQREYDFEELERELLQNEPLYDSNK